MAAYAYDPERNKRRSMVLLGAGVLHVFFIWAFASGLARDLVTYIAPPLDTTIIEEEKIKEEPPPPPPPQLERPPVQVVAPEITINLTPDTPPPPIQQITTQAVVSVPAPPRAPVAAIPGTPIKVTSFPEVDDYYPSSSKQANQEGVVKVQVCVSSGNKLGTTELKETSGFPLLDEAGVKVAKLGRYKAATSEGKNVDSCSTLPIRFKIKK
jgi:protein TonB